MSKITITVSGPVGVGKSTVCAKLETLLKHLGCQVEWFGGQEEHNLSLEDWTDYAKIPIEIVERIVHTVKVYETYTEQNGWLRVSQEEYDLTKDRYEHRILRIPASEIIDYAQVDELIAKHSEWTSQGYGIIDSHRHKFAQDILALVGAEPKHREEDHSTDQVAQVSDIDPVGFMMKHQTGPDRGFSWVKEDIKFSKEWERVGLYTEDQVLEMLKEAGKNYDDRALKWRTSFDAMHRRAMRSESRIGPAKFILEPAKFILDETDDPIEQEFNTPTISHEEAMKYVNRDQK